MDYPYGTLINDRYHIINKVVNGSISEVYMATDGDSPKKKYPTSLAIKITSSEHFRNSIFMKECLEQEAEIHRELNHPNIIPFHDSFYDQWGNFCLLTQYIHAGDLLDLNDTIRKEKFIRKLYQQVVQAVNYCHSQGVMHRDIKLENILFNGQNVKLADFGFATRDTKSYDSSGTHAYQSPEQLLGEEYDFRIDLWTLGILLHELLYKCNPFPKTTTNQQLIATIRRRSPVKFVAKPYRSENAKQLVNALLQFFPQDRLTTDEILKHPWLL